MMFQKSNCLACIASLMNDYIRDVTFDACHNANNRRRSIIIIACVNNDDNNNLHAFKQDCDHFSERNIHAI